MSFKMKGPSLYASPLKNKCSKAWKAWEAGYAKKEGGKAEAARERREFYCDNGKIKLRPSTDLDVPLTDEQIKSRRKK